MDNNEENEICKRYVSDDNGLCWRSYLDDCADTGCEEHIKYEQ